MLTNTWSDFASFVDIMLSHLLRYHFRYGLELHSLFKCLQNRNMPKCSIQKMLHLSDEGHSTAQFLMQKIIITTYRESYDRRKTAI